MKSFRICDYCGTLFSKENKEINRKLALGHTRFYCGISCHAYFSNALPWRRELSSKLAKQNFAGVNDNPEIMSKAHLASQKWKYVEIEKYLQSVGVSYEFEFPLRDATGKIRLYDLCLPFDWVLVEFDGPNHWRDKKYIEETDKLKELKAASDGWRLFRYPVVPNAIIPATLGASIISNL